MFDSVSRTFMVFDVESIGLQGEGFVAAFVLVDRRGNLIDEGLFACDPALARGTDEDRSWVTDNVHIDPDEAVSCHDPRDVRSEFWAYWCKHHEEQDATLWAECPWPVEARFLAACVDDSPSDRSYSGPYPLYDIATLRLAAGFDPLAIVHRRENEIPPHNPLADARQGARLLIEALNEIGWP